MDDIRVSHCAPALLAPAAVVRQFAGSRIEQQLLTQVFDLVWQVRNDAVMDDSPPGNCPPLARTKRQAPSLVASAESISLQGGWR